MDKGTTVFFPQQKGLIWGKKKRLQSGVCNQSESGAIPRDTKERRSNTEASGGGGAVTNTRALPIGPRT